MWFSPLSSTSFGTNRVVIAPLKKEDIATIVDLSFEVFDVKMYFMLRLGKRFLIDFYNIVYDSGAKHLFVATCGDEINGFLIGYPDTSVISRHLGKNALGIGWKMLTGRYQLDMSIRELFISGYKNYKYMDRHLGTQSEGVGELLSMAVKTNWQGQGIGRQLIEAYEASLKGKTTLYHVFTHSRLAKTLAFYRKMGCHQT